MTPNACKLIYHGTGGALLGLVLKNVILTLLTLVSVTIAAGGLAIHRADGSIMVWPIGEIRQTQGSFSSEQLRIERG